MKQVKGRTESKVLVAAAYIVFIFQMSVAIACVGTLLLGLLL